ncbi:DNA replication complex GINS protein Sld5p [[Candida] jaroonii]|uniref:DNA replication complex GINS protein Sld5p n=1 Tax=[Candida] jaroonii TaxID=467808 RepID=A0ACA9Y7I7_9ASCO|nr:DNA replication complex GINS protein Sld5p [[Candida] jaroonii]
MEVDDILRDFEKSTQKDQDLYKSLTTAMLNERMAPELLPYQQSLLEDVLSKISSQQQFLLDSHEYGDINIDSGIITSDFKLQLMIIETDIERLNYLVRSYLRVRLSKIDKFSIHYIDMISTNRDSKLLSFEEQSYISRHFKLMTDLYNGSFLKKVPQDLAYLDTDSGISMIVKPEIDQLVFIKVNKGDIVLELEDDDELELIPGGIYIVKYSLVRRYVDIGDIELI